MTCSPTNKKNMRRKFVLEGSCPAPLTAARSLLVRGGGYNGTYESINDGIDIKSLVFVYRLDGMEYDNDDDKGNSNTNY